MPPAARVTDTHACFTIDPGPKPHNPPLGPIAPPCSTTVETNNLAQARATDKLTCATPAPNFIVTGAATVEVNNLMAARATDKTMHPPPGIILSPCSPDVEIGGPTAGAMLANSKGTAACFLAANGRASGSTSQSFQNCSLESPRQIINRMAAPGLTEQLLFNFATTNRGPGGSPLAGPRGGAYPADQVRILGTFGVPAHQEAGTNARLAQAVAEGRGVTASLDAADIWGRNTPPRSYHTVLVTGVQYDQYGNLVNIIVNDTGPSPPNCGISYPAAKFQTGMNRHSYPGGNLVVTNNRVW